MKKSMLLALCLSVGYVWLNNGAATAAASTTSMSVAANDDEQGDNTFGTGDNTVTLTTTDDGKTLTISGKGDLTQLDKTYYFVSTLPGKIFSDDSHAEVSGGAAYSSSTTYSTRSNVYTEIQDFKNTYVENKVTSTEYYFNETGASTYYTWTYDWNTNEGKMVAVTNGSKVDTQNTYVAGRPEGETGCIYFTKSGDEYTRVANISTITSSEGVTSKDIYTDVLKDINNVYASADGVTYSQVYVGNTYDSSKTYYTLSYTYSNVDFAFLSTNNYLRYENDLIQALWKIGADKKVENVKFVNEDSSNPLYIDNDIVKAILYYQTKNDYSTWYESNTTITSFDLSAATCKNFSQTTFANDLDARGSLAITDLTLPLAEAKDDVMTVPTLVVEALRGANGTQPLAKVTVPEGYTKIGARAFLQLNNVEFTLPDAITEICDSAFSQTSMTSWVLPTSLVTIGTRAFYSCQSITSVTFPKTLRTIGPSAFADCKSYNVITLNEGLEIISNCAFFRNSSTDEQKVFSVPSSVKYMGPGAFFGHRYMDVYYYGEKAPLSPYGKLIEQTTAGDQVSAFDGAVYMGNSGFTPAEYKEGVESTLGDTNKGYANRENYINGGNYIAVLHFRSDISEENAETFTDITRKYENWLTEKTDPTTGEGTGEYYWYKSAQKKVGGETEEFYFGQTRPGEKQVVNPGYEDTSLGSQFIWPSQIQWLRSYCANSNGYKWNGTDKYLPALSKDTIDFIKAQEPSMKDYTDDEIKKLAYMSTRQFVLVSRDVKGPNPDYPVPATSGERWWTLCVPCDVTKAEVDKVFGKGTHLCLFSKVERTIDSEKGNTLHLYFQNDTYVNKYTRNTNGTWTKGEAVGDDDDAVVLYAHTPYMIYPTQNPTDGKQYILSNYELQAGDVRVSVVDANGGQSTGDIKYEFAGTYRSKITITTTDKDGNTTTTSSPVHIPQYTYAFGKKNNSAPQFWFYTGTNGTWVANKCLVERYDENGKNDLDTFFGGNDKTSNAKQISTFGDDDSETTAIDRVVYHYGDESTDAPIYNLGGQLVRQNGDQSGLAKGIYVQNGKKFVVK